MRKIVILDGYTVNPGDLSWERLRESGELTVYDRTAEDQVIERSEGAEIILLSKVAMGKVQFERLPYLRYVGVLATGYNIVDPAAAAEKGITVTNIPAYSTNSVAQMVFALVLELCHRTQWHSDLVMKGRWSESPDFCFWDYPLMELAGKTMGVIGMGNIGNKVCDIATQFGMELLGNERSRSDQSHRVNFRWVDLEELLHYSDIVTLHCPLTPETKGVINRETLNLMKKSAFLVNTSRGPVVVDEDLAEALNTGIIAGAGLDVLSVEPPARNNPLFSARNCIITPHIAWATLEARKRLIDIAVQNVRSWIEGSPVNVVI